MTLKLHDLQPAEGSKQKKTRVGRGTGSGRGKTSGRGMKGQKARSSIHPLFEGGQTRLFKQFPKVGFTNANFKTENAIVNVKELNRFADESEVKVEDLQEAGLISKVKDGVKILGDGELEKSLTVKAHKFSKSAVEKIEAAGGKAEVI